jgi:Spy/CpxP family protein refolding chaperone
MKRFHFNKLIFTALLLVFAFSAATAQFPAAQEVGNPQPRPNLLRELDLSNDQIQRIRRLNQERRPLMQESQRRLRKANIALDEAIYAETENEALIQSRLKDLEAAQTEVNKNRIFTEREIRKILTPEQLARFRSLRAESMRRNNPGNRMMNRPGGMRNNPRRFPPKPPGNAPRRP